MGSGNEGMREFYHGQVNYQGTFGRKPNFLAIGAIGREWLNEPEGIPE